MIHVRFFLAAALVLIAGPGAAFADLTPSVSCTGVVSTVRDSTVVTTGRDSTAGSATRDSTATTAGRDSTAAPARVATRYRHPDSALIASLRKGGYILVFRHGKTDWAQRDASVLDFSNRNAQRNLSEIGRKESVEVGKAITALHIPVGEVLSSPMLRCRDTADLAFGRCDTTIDLFQRGRASREARLRLLGTPPKAGTNLVLVTHQDVLIPIMSLSREELGEGEALIVQPLGSGTFKVLAQATPADWTRFLPSRKL